MRITALFAYRMCHDLIGREMGPPQNVEDAEISVLSSESELYTPKKKRNKTNISEQNKYFRTVSTSLSRLPRLCD